MSGTGEQPIEGFPAIGQYELVEEPGWEVPDPVVEDELPEAELSDAEPDPDEDLVDPDDEDPVDPDDDDPYGEAE
jgi:hypothetical protein